MRAMASIPTNIDVLALMRQRAALGRTAHPMALLPHQTSINRVSADEDLRRHAGRAISNSFRRRLKGKERSCRRCLAIAISSRPRDADIKRLLDAFLHVKPLRMAEQKLPNVFADAGIEGFIREACWPRSRPAATPSISTRWMRRRNGRDLCRRLGWRRSR